METFLHCPCCPRLPFLKTTSPLGGIICPWAFGGGCAKKPCHRGDTGLFVSPKSEGIFLTICALEEEEGTIPWSTPPCSITVASWVTVLLDLAPLPCPPRMGFGWVGAEPSLVPLPSAQA